MIPLSASEITAQSPPMLQPCCRQFQGAGLRSPLLRWRPCHGTRKGSRSGRTSSGSTNGPGALGSASTPVLAQFREQPRHGEQLREGGLLALFAGNLAPDVTHSNLMFDFLITSAHRRRSEAMKLAASEGELPTGSPARSMMRRRICGSFNTV